MIKSALYSRVQIYNLRDLRPSVLTTTTKRDSPFCGYREQLFIRESDIIFFCNSLWSSCYVSFAAFYYLYFLHYNLLQK